VNRLLVVGILFVWSVGMSAASHVGASKASKLLAAPSFLSQLPSDLPGGGVIIFGPEPFAWRVWPKGRIEFSIDSGHTWDQQKSGVTTDLSAGYAPSGKVCWVVGKAGTILLTTDRGKHWKKLPSPTTEDIEGVNAEDAKHASVWTPAHKRSFATDDGGFNWNRNEEK
jgi:photosystem II stability/assembly factor-like uncharacterized protein